MPRDPRLIIPFPIETAEFGMAKDPSVVRVGLRFSVNWAAIWEQPASYLYEVYDHDHRLLYVGITDWFAQRWSAHLGKSWWARHAQIGYILLRGYTSRREARKAEAVAIAEHRPQYNTKPERRYLTIAADEGIEEDVLIAELVPVGGRNG